MGRREGGRKGRGPRKAGRPRRGSLRTGSVEGSVKAWKKARRSRE